VYESLTSEGVHCDLMTGQEKREVHFATHAACTIEMTPMGEE
jgi:ATP-dependent RNA helicase SUPV3L1/SUV3